LINRRSCRAGVWGWSNPLSRPPAVHCQRQLQTWVMPRPRKRSGGRASTRTSIVSSKLLEFRRRLGTDDISLAVLCSQTLATDAHTKKTPTESSQSVEYNPIINRRLRLTMSNKVALSSSLSSSAALLRAALRRPSSSSSLSSSRCCVGVVAKTLGSTRYVCCGYHPSPLPFPLPYPSLPIQLSHDFSTIQISR